MRNFIYYFFLVATSLVSACSKSDADESLRADQVGTLSVSVRSEGIYYRSHLPISPLKGAVVTVKDGSVVVAADSTDVTGYICLTNIPEGSYEVEISYRDLKPLTFQTAIRGKEVTTLKSEFFDCVFLPECEVEKKTWTVIHFVNLADIQIEKGLLSDIRMIEKYGGSGDEVNHVVYIPATGNYLNKSSIYYLIRPQFDIENEQLYNDNIMPQLFSPAYVYENYDYTNADPSDYKLLERSILAISNLFPSDSLMLSIYDHGTGIDFSFLDDGGGHIHHNSISGNFHTKGEITMPQLREVLANVKEQGHTVNALVFGACLMAAFEVGYELKDCGVSYIVAAEPTSSGLHYGAKTWVEEFNDGAISGLEVCRRIVRGVGPGNVFAVWNIKHFGELTALFNDFAEKIVTVDVNKIKPLIAKTVKVMDKGGTPPELTYSCYDLADFAKNVSEGQFEDPMGLRVSAKRIYDFLNLTGADNFISEFHNPWQGDYSRARGVGVLIRAPDYPYQGHNKTVYRQHRYYLDGNTDWDKFLMSLD